VPGAGPAQEGERDGLYCGDEKITDAKFASERAYGKSQRSREND